MNFEQFYPTPPELAEKVAELIQFPCTPILEPGAGDGALIEGFSKTDCRSWQHRYSEKDFHCIEINPERAVILKDKEYTVIWDDFMTFDPLMPYKTIIMNPPFHSGAKHLLKALNILADGGEIACILNAETIKNPYTNERKELLRQIEESEESKIEFVQSAFDDTDVEVALIYVKKKDTSDRCITFENFKKNVVAERQEKGDFAMTRYNATDALIDRYRAEVKTALRLYDEILNYNKVSLHAQYHEVFEIKISSGHKAGASGIVQAINYNYWRELLYSEELNHLLTNDARQAYTLKLREMSEYEFNERNILQLKEDLCKSLFGNIDDAIMKVWHDFTCRFSWNEYSKNIHYYNGWKTNKAFKCNKKIIIPLYAFSDWCGEKSLKTYKVQGALSDIEKAMNYLDCGRTEDPDMFEKLKVAQERNENLGIDTKYFVVNLYKKGTAHLTFKDMELLKKFNLYCGKKNKWLPDDYGTKPYDKLSVEEKAVADSFEGEKSYTETYRNRQFYLPQNTTNLLMLTAG